jgi:hypothetical protein
MRTQLTIALLGCTTGLVLVAAGALLPALALFLIGGVVAGLGVGLLFKGALGTAIGLAEPGRRGETLALVFLIAYAGLAVPALGVGAALAFVPAIVALVVFVGLVLVATTVATVLMRRRAAR